MFTIKSPPRFGIGAIVLLTMLPAISPAAVTPNPTYFVGTWTCASTMGHSRFREVDNDTLFGTWVRQDAQYDAHDGMKTARGVSFLRYDPTVKHWVFLSVSDDGEYFASANTSSSYSGVWQAVYPRSPGRTIIRVAGARKYIIDYSAPAAKGKTVTLHQVCAKQ